jgi:hypothetical protein
MIAREKLATSSWSGIVHLVLVKHSSSFHIRPEIFSYRRKSGTTLMERFSILAFHYLNNQEGYHPEPDFCVLSIGKAHPDTLSYDLYITFEQS